MENNSYISKQNNKPTMRTHHDYCLILAGGTGRRLWPYSRKDKPKQFLDFFGSGRTLLQQTYERFARFIPKENIYVSTFKDYYDLVREQLPELDDEHVLAEPVQLSTAPAVAWASYHISLRDPEANMVVAPADQWVMNEEAFAREVGEGLQFVATHPDFLAMAVKPSFPSTAYGYIQKGEAGGESGFSRVQSFSEKPSAEFARVFLESGEFLWNTGLFLWNIQTMRRRLAELMPMAASRLENIVGGFTLEEERKFIKRFYPSNMRLSIDLVILERSSNVYVRECNFGWADIGGWNDVYSVEKHDVDGNALVGSKRVMFTGSKGNLVNLPEGTAAVIDGLEGYLVSLSNNVLVICRNPAQVRKLGNEAQMQLGNDFV